MNTHENKLRHVVSALTAGAFAVILATACSSSDDNPNPDIVGDSAIPTTDTAKDTTTTDTATSIDTLVSDSPPSETVADSSDAKWDPDSGACFPGDPTTDIEFFDKCTSATCIPYDNSKLTKLGPGGTLPALP
jgi:hypothetical protein